MVILFQLKKKLLKYAYVIPFVFVFCGCTQMAKLPHNKNTSQGQEPQLLSSPFTLPADAYVALAHKQSGVDRLALLLLAAGRFIDDGQWRQALNILMQPEWAAFSKSPQSLNALDLVDEKNILLAKIDMIRDFPRDALAKMSHVRNINHLSVYYQAQFHEILAKAYQKTGQLNLSISERIKLGSILPDATMQLNNNRVLWLILMQLSEPDLQTMSMEAQTGSILKGWLDLALIARSDLKSGTLFSRMQQWEEQYSNHPARQLLPRNTDSMKPSMISKPEHIALLLPITGALAEPGNAIKDGFMDAYEASDPAHHAEVKIYNTDGNNASDLYQQAIEEQADFVVGPLSKADVAAVAQSAHPVPTILLNELNSTPTGLLYEFSLSPMQEALQVARQAHNHGRSRALIIAPEGEWGRSIISVFSQQWQSMGGVIVDAYYYHPNTDLNNGIAQILGVAGGETRVKELRRFLGHSIELVSSRRQDVDMIFLLAYPSQARQIMPLIRYYYAGDLPIYATSVVYSGTPDTMKDRDLDGIILGDMPELFKNPKSQKPWPETFNSYNRLYALGQDSYALTQELGKLRLFPASSAEHRTGILYLTPQNKIIRLLTWGKFQQGMIVPMAPVSTTSR